MDSGFWPLYRFDPRRAAAGENPLKLDSKAPEQPFEKYALSETRFRMLMQANPERAKRLLKEAQRVATARFDLYRQLAQLSCGQGSTDQPS